MIARPKQTGCGRADEHQLALHTLAGHASLQHILGGDVTGRIVPIEVNPEPAVLVGWHLQTRNRNALHTGLIRSYEDRARICDDPQQLHGERGHYPPLSPQDDWHSADNSVPLRQDRKDAAPSRRLLDQWQVTQQSCKRYEKGARVRPPNGKAGL